MNRLCVFDSYPNRQWSIDDSGQVYMLKNNTLIRVKSTLNKKRGYHYIRTRNGNYSIHRLVARFFVNNPDNKEIVNHKDGNKLNNHFTNLEWVTCKENAQHAIKNGLTRQMRKNEGNIKYSLEICKNVVKAIKNGLTYEKAGLLYGMPYSTVAHLMRGSRRKI